MARRVWWIGGVLLALAGAGLLAWRSEVLPIRVEAPEPSLTADLADTLSPVPPSVLVAPIAFDLGPAIARFEEDVPRRFGSMERRLRSDSTARASIAFTASRSPFRVSVEGSEIDIETVLEYEGRVWYNPPLGPEVSAGCGGGDDPKPRLLLRIVSTPTFTPAWQLRTSTRLEIAPFSNEPRDQCQVTILKIDVTGKVVGAVRERMTRKLARLDRHIAESDTRGRIEEIWRKMERPIRLTDGVWLLLQPAGAQLASFRGAGDSLVAVLRLEARPRIVTGARPLESTLVTPLPPLRTVAGADLDPGIHLLLEGIFSYDAATALMQKQLVGKVIRMAGRPARIEGVTLQGIGGGRVALGITFSGAVQGRVFLTGTPRLDRETRQLSVADLEFDAGTTIVHGPRFSWWQGDVVRSFLRAKAVIPDSAALAGVERLAVRGMNRELAPGVRLEVTLDDSRGLAISATREHLVVRARAEGQARLDVDRVLARVRHRPPPSEGSESE